MASLETLRTKGGIIVTAVISVALLAFLIGDIFSSGNSILNSRKMRVGEINGNNIDYVEFLNEADYVGDIYKMMWGRESFSSQEQEQIYEIAWGQFMMKDSYIPGFESMGLFVSETEQIDMVNGIYISPVVQAFFTNPQTGTFDPELMKSFMSNVNSNNGSFALWSFMRRQMEQERAISKYTALVSGGFYANALEVEHGVKAATDSFAARVVGGEYASIADSLVTVTDAQIKKYYNENKRAFKQEAARDIEYVVFDVMPSQEDYDAAKAAVDEIAVEFAQSDAPMQYATLNSQEKADSRYYRADQLSAELAALAFAPTGMNMSGPTLNGDIYTLSRVADKKTMPDTVGAKQILLAKGSDVLADSILTALRGGADFASLAMAKSMDPSVMQNSGDMGRFTPDMAPEEFADATIKANVGDYYKVETPAGIHVAQLTYKSRPVQKAQIATVTYRLDPSAATIQSAYQKASNFLTAVGGTAEGFRQAVTDEGLSKRTVRIRTNERTISGLDNSKELVRWAFNGKKDEVSQIIDIDGSYFVAALVDVKEDGHTPLAQVSEQIAQTLRNEAKAAMLMEKMNGTTLEAVAQALGAEIADVTDVKWDSFYIPQIGVEPRVIGAMYATQPNVLSAPIEGGAGVYRFVITDVTKAEGITPESEKARIDASSLFYINERMMQALTEESHVKDMRVKFF